MEHNLTSDLKYKLLKFVFSTGCEAHIFRGGRQERREPDGDVAVRGEASEPLESQTLRRADPRSVEPRAERRKGAHEGSRRTKLDDGVHRRCDKQPALTMILV